MVRRHPGLGAWISLVFSLAILVGSICWPWLGLAVPGLVLVAAVSTFVRPRWFCSTACPRARILTGFIGPVSRYRPSPKGLSSPAVRNPLCGFLMVCSIAQTARLWGQWDALGWFFWAVCATTLVASLVLGWWNKPRTWCTVCPVGTLQQTLRGH
jgi:polyferredoxin